MPHETIIYKREELYDQVWTDPISLVAKRYGVSDVALAKICKKLHVPRPSRGYWVRKAAGKKVRRDRLPALPKGVEAEYRVERWKDPAEEVEIGEEARQLLDREQDPSMAVTVPDDRRKAHPWIRKSRGALRASAKNRDQVFRERACLDVRTCNKERPRALRIADTLLKALEARGFKVEVTEPDKRPGLDYYSRRDITPSKTGVHILGSFVEFGIEEGRDIIKTEHETEHHGRGSNAYSYTPPPTYEHRPNGKLTLKIKRSYRHRARTTWSDGKKQRVEDCLNAFIVGLIHTAEHERIWRAERDRQHREWEEQQQRRLEQERKREVEKARIHDLDKRVSAWRKAKTIREFLEEVEAAARQLGDDLSPDSDLTRWLAWARGYAEKSRQRAIEATLELGSEDQNP